METNSPEEPRSSRFSLRDLLVLIAVVGFLLIGLAIPAIHVARDEARRAQCANNLLQIGLGLQCYRDSYQSFPPAFIPDEEGQPRHSWRVTSLPFWTCDSFYESYDFRQPWDGPGNLKLAATKGQCQYYFHCPADQSLGSMTNYLAVVGETTAWPGPVPSHVEDFSKGTSHSILLVEQANSGIAWTEPRDLAFDGLDLTIHSASRLGFSRPPLGSGQVISSHHPNGAHAVFADASVEFLSADTSDQVLKDMLVIGGEPEVLLGPRKRMGHVYDPDAANEGPKSLPYRLESYTLDETGDASR